MYRSRLFNFSLVDILIELKIVQYGLVAKGRDPSTGEIVAIKTFKSNIFENDSKGDEYLHEAAMLLKVDHENVIKLLEKFEDYTGKCLVFVFMERTLSDEIYDESYEYNLDCTQDVLTMLLSQQQQQCRPLY